MDNFDLRHFLYNNKLIKENTEYALSQDPDGVVGKPQDPEDHTKESEIDYAIMDAAKDAFLAAGGTEEGFSEYWKSQYSDVPLEENIDTSGLAFSIGDESQYKIIDIVLEISHLADRLKEKYQAHGDLDKSSVDREAQEMLYWVQKLNK